MYRDARANGSAGGGLRASVACCSRRSSLGGGGGDDIVGSPHIFLMGGLWWYCACLARLQQTEFLSRIACIYLQPPSSWLSIPVCFPCFSPSNFVSLPVSSFLFARYPRYPSSDVALISSSYLAPAAFPTPRRYPPAPPSNQGALSWSLTKSRLTPFGRPTFAVPRDRACSSALTPQSPLHHRPAGSNSRQALDHRKSYTY